MKLLHELVRTLTQNKTKSITVLDLDRQGDTKLERLFRLLRQDEELTDERARAELYPDRDSPSSYHKLKYELTDRLINTAFLIDVKDSKYSDRRRALVECQRQLSFSVIMNNLYARQNAIAACERAIRVSQRYHFTLEEISATQRLLHLLNITGRTKRSRQLYDRSFQLMELNQKETSARLHLMELQSHFINARSGKKRHVTDLAERIAAVRALPGQLTSPALISSLALLEMAHCQATGDADRAARVLEGSLAELREAGFSSQEQEFKLTLNLLTVYLVQKEFSKGNALYNDALERLRPREYNRYRLDEVHFVFLLHTHQYAAAVALHRQVTRKRDFSGQAAHVREVWAIFGAYLEILRAAGRIPASEDPPTFRINRYLNTVETFAKDKSGHNVPVLISHVVLLLQKNDLDAIDDRTEALDKYRSRYLRGPENRRGELFFRMLRQLPRAHFDPAELILRTTPLLDELKAISTALGSVSYDQEIIPYEDLWNIILEELSKRKYD